MQELYKVVIALVVVLFGSWALFGWVVKRWVSATDTKIKELDDSIDENTIDISVIKTRCEERNNYDKN